MKKNFGILKTSGLFEGIDNNLETMLTCLGSEIKSFSEGEIILLAGDKPDNIGIVLSGQLHISRDDFDGNRLLIAAIAPGGIFAEVLCCAGILQSPVTVTANSESSVVLLEFSRILHTCPNSCSFHVKLIENMLRIIANKNLFLQSRIELVCLKTVRAKVVRYLESFLPMRGQEFTVPLNREEMADFLCVERSALSHELARMKTDGLIEYRKNKFILFQNDRFMG